jgi:SAM-dependent methyltransferase
MKSWEDAVRWCLNTPAMADLARDAYFGDPVEAALRYRASPEYACVKCVIPQTPGRVLDLGAGNGVLSWALAADGWDATAVEPDPSDLIGAGAIRTLAEQTGTPITVIEAMGEDIPLESAGFDLIVARQVLHHAQDLPAFCSEMARLSRKRATILALRDHVISGAEQLRPFLDHHPLHHLYGGENAFTLPEYRSAISSAGLFIKSEWRSFQSVMNYDPMTQDEIRGKLAAVTGPLNGPVGAVLKRLPFGLIAEVATALDRRPGRLVSFLAINEGTSNT